MRAGTNATIRVLVVDDSAIARQAIREALAHDPGITVVGTAADPYEAREQILRLQPQVLTLDMQMPRMDGLSFLKILRQHHPLPVVVLSSLTPEGSELAVSALEAGAIDVLAKPDNARAARELGRRLCASVRTAAQARIPRPGEESTPPAPPPARLPEARERRVILIGASTGGVEALRFLLPRLPVGLPPIVVVQHILSDFTRVFVEHLDRLAPFPVREAREGELLRCGECVVAPGDHHLLLERGGAGYALRLAQTPPVNHCRPSVDVLFRSAAELAGKHAIAVLLTGMGADGARGMQMLRAAGACTLAEAEESCVVFGMPAAAIATGAVERVAPLRRMPGEILEALDRIAPGGPGKGEGRDASSR